MHYKSSKILIFFLIISALIIVEIPLSSVEAFAKKTKKSSHQIQKKSTSSKSKQKRATQKSKNKPQKKATTNKSKSKKGKKNVAAEAASISKSKNANINDRQQELDNLNKAINDTRKQIEKLKGKEKYTVNNLTKNKIKGSQVSKKIEQLQLKIKMLQDSIYSLQSTHRKLTSKLVTTQNSFAAASSKIYLNDENTPDDFMAFTSAVDEALISTVVTKHFTSNLNKSTAKINHQRDSVSGKASMLQEITKEQAIAKQQKEKEKVVINKTIATNQKELSKIKSQQGLLLKQLAEKQRSAKKLKSIIGELVRKEILKQKSAEKHKTTEKTASKEKETTKSSSKNYDTHQSTHTTVHVGKIIWPIASHNLFRGYGANRNSATNTIFDNPGVDISAKPGSSVIAVANGTVSLIHWLPGYGTLIIINHGGGIRSVYANLSTVNVKKDDEVRQGKVIGRSGKSIDGEFLHFELWNGSNRMNPTSYLH